MNPTAPAEIEHSLETTRDVIQLAKASSIEFKHTHITPEHMLLGLLKQQGGDLARAFKLAKASPDQIRELILHHLRPGDEAIPEHLISFSERAKRVIESARQEAKRFRAPQLAPEHLLLGLTLVPNTVSGAVLRAVGLTTEAVREALGEA
jgi:ATP-dependent Clp protease ATP-binding subunit ClpC